VRNYERDYGHAIVYASRLIELYQSNAWQQQIVLQRQRLSYSAGASTQYWALNAVGTGYYLMGHAKLLNAQDLKARGKLGEAGRLTQEARQHFAFLTTNLPYAHLLTRDGNYYLYGGVIATMHPELSPPYFPRGVHYVAAIGGSLALALLLAHVLRQQGLWGRAKGRFRVHTTDSHHDQPIAPHRLADRPAPSAPNQIWVANITYIPTQEGWLYQAGVMDLYSRRIVGWAMDPNIDTQLVLSAWDMAPWNPSGAPSNTNRSVGAASKPAAKLARPTSISSKPFITGAASIAPSITCARLTLNAKRTNYVPHNFGVRFFEASPDVGAASDVVNEIAEQNRPMHAVLVGLSMGEAVGDVYVCTHSVSLPALVIML
jgi:hypothetical protein